MNLKTLVRLLAEGSVYGAAISVFSKLAQDQFPPLTFAFLRYLIALAILIPYAQAKQEQFPVRHWKQIAGIGVFFTANIVFFQFGIRHTTAISAQTLYAAIPALTGVLGWILLKDRVSQLSVLGIALGFLGTGLIAVLPALGSVSVGSLEGNAIILLALTCYTFYPVLTKKYLRPVSDPVIVTGTVMTGVLLLCVLLLVSPEGFSWLSKVRLSGVISLLVVGTLGTVRYSLIYLRLTKEASPMQASMLLYLQPITAVLLAYPLLGEAPTWSFTGAACISLVGICLLTYEKMKAEKLKAEKLKTIPA